MMSRASLMVRSDDEKHPSVLIDCHVEFDREAGKWRAFDELGNVAHDDWKHRAILRVFAMRLGAPMQEDSRG